MNQENNNFNNVDNKLDQEKDIIESKKEEKSYLGLLIVFIVISVLLASYIIYDKCFIKETKEPVQGTETSSWYHMETIAEYEVIDKETDSKTKVKYEYPIINIDSEDARDISEKLKKYVIEQNDEFINGNHLEIGCGDPMDTPSSTSFFTAYIINNGAKKDVGYYDVNRFIIKETEKEILILYETDSKETGASFCDGGGKKYIIAADTISKETGKKLSNKEIVESYGYNYDDVYYKLLRAIYLDKELGKENRNPSIDDLKEFEIEYEEVLKYINFFKLEDRLEASAGRITQDSPSHYYYDGSEFVVID